MNHSLSPSRCAGGALLALALTSTGLQAQPLLHCSVTYAGTSHSYDARLSNDANVDPAADTNGAYTIEAADIGGRFWFKAVLLGTPQRLDAVKIYAYLETSRRPVLLQEVKYVAPFTYSTVPNSLTGINLLYAGPLERELQYGCALQELQS